MPFLASILMRLSGLIGPLIAQIGWSLMTERMIRLVCGNTVLWIQETWFDDGQHPKAAEILKQGAEYILPPKQIK